MNSDKTKPVTPAFLLKCSTIYLLFLLCAHIYIIARPSIDLEIFSILATSEPFPTSNSIVMATTKKVKINDLLVNTENYRFEPVASQKEAIDKMVDDQGDKLYNLAEHILKNGFNPNDKVQVVVSNHDITKFNVLEGNRRTVAAKLVHTPELIDHSKHTSLKKKFKKLHDDNKRHLVKEIDCTVYENPAEADIWIKLKHAGQSEGVGTVAWTGQQVQRFEEKVEGKSSIALQTVKILQSSPDVSNDIKAGLGDLKITNLDRLIADPDVRDFLGIDIHNGLIQSDIEQKEVIKGLTRIAKDLLDPKFNVKKIYTKEDRKDYIKNFPKASVPNTSKKATKPWQFSASIAGPAKQPSKSKPNPKDRDVLIPKSCTLKIKNPRVNSMYHELQKLSVSKFTNASAVSLRVFIELSLDCFIEENNLAGVTKDSKLIAKVNAVSTHLETNNLADKHICKGIRNAVANKNDLVGIETWHAYVHNSRFSPTPTNLVITWDNIQNFMEKLWENVQ